MSVDFRDRLERELRAAHRRQAAPARSPRPRRRRHLALLPAAALAACAAIVIALLPSAPDPERAASPPPAASTPAHLLGIYVGRGPGAPRLWIQAESIRVLGSSPDVQSELLGFVSVTGDRLELRVDPERAAADPFPGPFCRGGRVGDRGTYRFSRRGRVLTFRLVEDPCAGRARLLTGRRWRRR